MRRSGPAVGPVLSCVVLVLLASFLSATESVAAPPAGHAWVTTDRIQGLDTTYDAVDCGGPGECWASEAGELLESTDLGGSWTDRSDVLPAGTTAVHDVACPDAGHCRITLATDSGPVLLVVDGDQTATRPIPAFSGDTRMRIGCATALRCVVATYGSTVERTVDGGVTWSSGTLPRSISQPTVSCAPGRALCLLVGNEPSAARSRDGGRTWEKVTLPTGIRTSSDVDCPTATDCRVAANGGLITTTDAGDTWTVTTLPVGAGTVDAVSCVSATGCRTVGRDGSYPDPLFQGGATTTDGVTWTADAASDAEVTSSVDVACVAQVRCVTVWAGTARRTSPAPRSLEVTLPAAPTSVAGAGCLTDGSCVAVGTDVAGRPVAVHGVPGALTVTIMPPAVGRPDLVDCAGRSACVVLSSAPAEHGSGRVRSAWRTADGGLTWTAASLPDPADGLNRAVSCATSSACLEAGRTGAVVSLAGTVDGGATWTPVPTPAGATDLSALSCVSAAACVALGTGSGGATGWRTVDLGTTWTPVGAPVLADGYDQVACWRTTCLAASDDRGTSARSIDRGVTWTRRNTPNHAPLSSLTCTAQGRCAAFAVGTGPVVSVDGGLTWRIDTGASGEFGCVGTVCVAVYAGRAGLVEAADGLPPVAGGV